MTAPEPAGRDQGGRHGLEAAHADVLLDDRPKQALGIEGEDAVDGQSVLLLRLGPAHVMAHVGAGHDEHGASERRGRHRPAAFPRPSRSAKEAAWDTQTGTMETSGIEVLEERDLDLEGVLLFMGLRVVPAQRAGVEQGLRQARLDRDLAQGRLPGSFALDREDGTDGPVPGPQDDAPYPGSTTDENTAPATAPE